MPLISIITVCFNAAGTLRHTLDSVCEQGWQDFECIVVDGGSTDDSLAILAEYAGRVDKLVSEPDRGIYDAMNKGVGLARGDFLFFLNADDRFADAGVLADVRAVLGRDSRIDLLYGNAIYDYDGHLDRQRYDWVTTSTLLFGNLCHQAVFARRALFDSIGPFDLDYPIVADYDWFLKVFRSGARTCYFDRDIARFHAGGMHARNLEKLRKEKRRVQRKYVDVLNYVVGNSLFRLRRRLGLLPRAKCVVG